MNDLPLRAVLTVTIETREGGDYYFDHDDLLANVIPWVEGALDDRDDITQVTIEAQPPAVPVPAADRAALRDRIAEALYAHDHPGWRVPLAESVVELVYRARAAGVLSVLPAPADRAAVLSGAERTMLTYALDQAQEKIWSEDGFTDEDQAAVTSLRRLAAEAPTTKPETETLASMLEGLGRLLATSSRDWGLYAPDAWLYAVVLGWDCEQDEHDETCTHGAMEEMQQRHGWSDEAVAKARRYRAAVRALTASTAESGPVAPAQKRADA